MPGAGAAQPPSSPPLSQPAPPAAPAPRRFPAFPASAKSLPARREDGVGVGGAAGRLAELGQRQRGAQFEAARGSPLCDRDGGQEGLFRGRGVGGAAIEQNFAARPMQFRFERAKAQAVARRQRFVDDRDGAQRDRPPGPRPRPARSSTARRTSEPSVRARALRRGAYPRVRRLGAPCVRRLPSPQETSSNAPHMFRLLPCEADEFECVLRGARMLAAHQFEHGRVHLPYASVPNG